MKFVEVVRDVEIALISVKDLAQHTSCLKTISDILDRAAEHLKRLQIGLSKARVVSTVLVFLMRRSRLGYRLRFVEDKSFYSVFFVRSRISNREGRK